jgi:hypothetical protein
MDCEYERGTDGVVITTEERIVSTREERTEL